MKNKEIVEAKVEVKSAIDILKEKLKAQEKVLSEIDGVEPKATISREGRVYKITGEGLGCSYNSSLFKIEEGHKVIQFKLEKVVPIGTVVIRQEGNKALKLIKDDSAIGHLDNVWFKEKTYKVQKQILDYEFIVEEGCGEFTISIQANEDEPIIYTIKYDLKCN